MRFCFRPGGIALVAALLAGCDRSGPPSAKKNGQPAASSTVSANPAGSAGRKEVVTASGVETVFLPGGTFQMGSDTGGRDEAPAHKVSVSGFLMDKYEVTHELFAQAQLPDPSHWRDSPRGPVERVRWRDAKQYCNERSQLESLKPCYNEKTPDWDCDFTASGYRLPTEAEWEFASLAGTSGPYEFGTADKLRQFGWFSENAEQKTHAVGQKKPNRWGLYDLYGNVSEWCEDVYSATYYPNSPAQDPTGPPGTGADVRRVIKGGSWKSSPDQCRSAARQGEVTGDSDACFSTDFCGFRCVRRISEADLAKLKPGGK